MTKRKRRLLFLLSGKKYRWIRGAPPLSFKAVAGELKDYRIYGNTANGESVGDLVSEGEHAGEYKVPVTVEGKNLFNKNDPDVAVGYGIVRRGERTGELLLNSNLTATGYIPVKPGQTYTNNSSFRSSGDHGIAFYDENKNPISGIQAGTSTSAIIPYTYTAPDNAAYMRIPIVTSGSTSISIDEFQVEKGSEATAYESYQTPIDTNIYLPKQIKKVGNEAEYISYADQKMHRIGADDIDVTLPELPTLAGTNVLTVGTAVQPTRVDIKGRIKTI